MSWDFELVQEPYGAVTALEQLDAAKRSRDHFQERLMSAGMGTITTEMANGVISMVDGVFTYRVDDEGKVVALRAIWEFHNAKAFPPKG